ncbi:acetyl-coenzyme A transporter 1-domain-containing protein [Globomyces pollinis-pini]|nr:acetyl-coenzyme A transporter 1-domain-containing protein [Globomyces pollinis-pini]
MGPKRRGKKTMESKQLNEAKEPLIKDDLKTTKQDAKGDMGNIILLVILYLLQGVPLGLSFGSIPYILKSKLNYSDLALFSLSSYPYSLKLLWSPIVDSTFFKSIGRRKSWIIPIQFILGLFLIYMGSKINRYLELDEIPVTLLAISFTLMVFLCATQDIAVDGWAISLLTDENKAYASTAQTVGLNTGYFLSFTVFLAFNSPEFCNKYILSSPMEEGLISLGGYLQFWGFAFLVCNFWLVFFKTEVPDGEDEESISSVYKIIFDIIQMPHMKTFTFILLIAKIGFMANEAVTGLKLLELGFNKEYLALSVLIDFPLQMVFGYYAAKWSSGDKPLLPWLVGFYGRLFAALAGMAVVYAYPKEGVTDIYMAVVLFATVLGSFFNTIQFVGMGSYFTKISDPAIGGTYMTLLNTLSNLGGTWPKYFVFLAVDYFTDAPCSVLSQDGSSIKCSDNKSKETCISLGGKCSFISDGYYLVNTGCFLFGLLTLIFYIQPAIVKLQKIPDQQWRLKSKKKVLVKMK